jgi:hypothetical protein
MSAMGGKRTFGATTSAMRLGNTFAQHVAYPVTSEATHMTRRVGWPGQAFALVAYGSRVSTMFPPQAPVPKASQNLCDNTDAVAAWTCLEWTCRRNP